MEFEISLDCEIKKMFLVFEQAKLFQLNSSITTLNMWVPRALGGKIIKIYRIFCLFPEFEIPLKIKERTKSFICSPHPQTHTLEVIFRPLALHPEKNMQYFFFPPPPPSQIRVQDPYQPKFGIISIFYARASPATGILTIFTIFLGTPPPPPPPPFSNKILLQN